VAQFIPDLEEEEEEELIRQVAEAPTQAHAIKSISELEGGKMARGIRTYVRGFVPLSQFYDRF
jgi:hypothetical protein